jgi:hypothetical protein
VAVKAAEPLPVPREIGFAEVMAVEKQIAKMREACDALDESAIAELVDSIKTAKNASIASTIGSGVNLATGVTGKIMSAKGVSAPGGVNIALNVAAAAGSVTTTVASTVSAVSNLGIGGKVDTIVAQINACKEVMPSAAPEKVPDDGMVATRRYNEAAGQIESARAACSGLDAGALEKLKGAATANLAAGAVGALSGVSGITSQMGINPLAKGGGRAVLGMTTKMVRGDMTEAASGQLSGLNDSKKELDDQILAEKDSSKLAILKERQDTITSNIDKLKSNKDSYGEKEAAKTFGEKAKDAGGRLIDKEKVNSASITSMVSAGVGVAAGAVGIGISSDMLSKAEGVAAQIRACKAGFSVSPSLLTAF